MTSTTERPLAVVTGASSGIGLELAKQFVGHGFDLVITAENDELSAAAEHLRGMGAQVDAPAWASTGPSSARPTSTTT